MSGLSLPAIDQLNAALRGRYRIRRGIGEGGMATVYLAHDPKHDRDVAVKVVRPELAVSLGSERFLNEIKITANLQHPHILPLFDSGEVSSLLYYVMPYVVGETLRTKLDREKQLGIEESVLIAQSVAAALHYAHGSGVVHRDVKPSNVLLSDGLPLLGDFGIAGAIETADLDPPARFRVPLGTPGYMSPEQAAGDPVDSRSDVYALGCLLYEMVTGRPPFTGRTARAVLASVLMDPVPSAQHVRKSVPGEVDSVIRRALAKEPAERFSTAAGMAEALTGRSTRRADVRSALAVTPAARASSLAVLPFKNLSGNPEHAYFSDGVTDDITMSVARISGLRVISRASVLRYRGVSENVARVADELGVGSIIDGSVRRSGDNVRIVVQLVDASADAHLWSETYDRSLEDIFQVQSEVAASVARAVRRKLSRANRVGIEGRGTRDAEAYDRFLRGRFQWNQRTEASVAESVVHFGMALELDPDFALGHAGVADANTILGVYGARRTSEVMVAARVAAHRALELDPTLGEAWASLGCVSAVYDWDWAEAEAAFRRSLESAPSYATAHHWCAMNLLTPSRRFAEAVAALDRAEELDPDSIAIAVSRGIVAFYERDFEQAVKELEVAARAYPRFSLPHYFLGQCWDAVGHDERAEEPLRRAVSLSDESSETLAALGHSLAARGHVDDAEKVARRLGNRSRQRYVSPTLMAQLQLGFHRPEASLDLLEEAAEVRAADLVWLGVHPVYDPIRDEPRFQALLERLGLTT